MRLGCCLCCKSCYASCLQFIRSLSCTFIWQAIRTFLDTASTYTWASATRSIIVCLSLLKLFTSNVWWLKANWSLYLTLPEVIFYMIFSAIIANVRIPPPFFIECSFAALFIVIDITQLVFFCMLKEYSHRRFYNWMIFTTSGLIILGYMILITFLISHWKHKVVFWLFVEAGRLDALRDGGFLDFDGMKLSPTDLMYDMGDPTEPEYDCDEDEENEEDGSPENDEVARSNSKSKTPSLSTTPSSGSDKKKDTEKELRDSSTTGGNESENKDSEHNKKDSTAESENPKDTTRESENPKNNTGESEKKE